MHFLISNEIYFLQKGQLTGDNIILLHLVLTVLSRLTPVKCCEEKSVLSRLTPVNADIFLGNHLELVSVMSAAIKYKVQCNQQTIFNILDQFFVTASTMLKLRQTYANKSQQISQYCNHIGVEDFERFLMNEFSI